MITAEAIEQFEVALRHFVAKIPDVLTDMRATAQALETERAECDELRRTLDTMNVANGELREDKRMLDQRVQGLLAENARLEHLLSTIGQAVRQAHPVQDAIQSLSNGSQKVIEQH